MSNTRLQPVSSERLTSATTYEANRIYRKIAWRIMPVLFLIFVLSYMDRVNIGYAKLQFSRELGLSDAMYGAGAGIFFIGYLVAGIPSNLLLAKFGARATISRIMISWGIVSSLMMFISTPAQFYLLRFLLGLAEGGLAPGVYLYLTYWFPGAYRARMIAIFLAAIPVAGVLCAPLSGLLLDAMHHVLGLAGWQWMFLIEGVPSVIVGALVYFLIQDSPKSAPWLTATEKEAVSASLISNIQTHAKAATRSHTSEVFKSRIFITLVVVEIIGGISVAGFAYWLPQIVHDLGIVNIRKIGFITAIPYLFASVGMVCWGFLSDHFRERRWHYAIATFGSGVALFVVCQNTNHFPIAIGALALAYAGIMSSVSVFWAYATSYLRGGATAIGIGILNSFAALAAYLSQYAFGAVSMIKNSSIFGLYGIAIALLVGAVLMLSVPKNLQST